MLPIFGFEHKQSKGMAFSVYEIDDTVYIMGISVTEILE